jgi:hypothetical protein
MPTRRALQEIGEAAPIQKNQCLETAIQILPQRFDERRGHEISFIVPSWF